MYYLAGKGIQGIEWVNNRDEQLCKTMIPKICGFLVCRVSSEPVFQSLIL